MTTDELRSNRKPGICSACGGRVAPYCGRLWWEAGPDDGGDVVGRTPAGWRVTHNEAWQCEEARAEQATQKQDRRALRAAAYAVWHARTEQIGHVAEIDERDSYGRPCPQTSDADGCTVVRLPYPLPSVTYRPNTVGGYDALGAFREYVCGFCSAFSDSETYGFSGALDGWTVLGGETACPRHTDMLRQKAASFAGGLDRNQPTPIADYTHVKGL